MGQLWNDIAGYVITAVLGLIGGSAISRLRARIRVLPYTVFNGQIGQSSEGTFGNIEVLWGGVRHDRLFSSTLELINDSSYDYSNLIVKIIAGPNTKLHTQHCAIKGSSIEVVPSDAFKAQVPIVPDQLLSDEQYALIVRYREYLLPVFNRKQSAAFTFLTTVENGAPWPTVFLEVVHPGTRAVYRVPGPRVLGVSVKAAAIVGTVALIGIFGALMWIQPPLWAAMFVAMAAGAFAQFIGAVACRAWRELLWLIGR
jgi:hypothetical protein